MFHNDDGSTMNVKQVCNQAWDQFGVSAMLSEIAARLGWNARWLPSDDAANVAKDASALLAIAQRLEKIESVEREIAGC